MEYRTIDLFLYPLSSEVSQQRVADEISRMEEQGWRYVESKIVDESDIMLVFRR